MRLGNKHLFPFFYDKQHENYIKLEKKIHRFKSILYDFRTK